MSKTSVRHRRCRTQIQYRFTCNFKFTSICCRAPSVGVRRRSCFGLRYPFSVATNTSGDAWLPDKNISTTISTGNFLLKISTGVTLTNVETQSQNCRHHPLNLPTFPVAVPPTAATCRALPVLPRSNSRISEYILLSTPFSAAESGNSALILWA